MSYILLPVKLLAIGAIAFGIAIYIDAWTEAILAGIDTLLR